MSYETINIDLGEISYPIIIDNSGFNLNSLTTLLSNKKILIVTNHKVASLYLDQVLSQLTQNNVDVCILPDGEQHKNIENWQKIIDKMADFKMNRTDILVSLGGGVIGDMTGFAAASWMRGIDFIQVPTTLLAQVDASVGGKTGINHASGKNLIGAFHQPRAVVINTSTLDTLSDREFSAGLGEVVKYGFINQKDFICWLEDKAVSIMERNKTTLSQLIAKCCQFKADIVEQDEKEQGVRVLLNLGHSFGHAIETATHYQQFLHGEAVAIGMVMASELSESMGLCQVDLRKRMEKLLHQFDLKTKLIDTINAEELLILMRLDKKAIGNSHRLILMEDFGRAVLIENIKETDITAAINTCIS